MPNVGGYKFPLMALLQVDFRLRLLPLQLQHLLSRNRRFQWELSPLLLFRVFGLLGGLERGDFSLI